MTRTPFVVLMLASLTACAVGPGYRRPALELPAAYKEQTQWQPSEPADGLQRGPWWTLFKDPILDQLEDQVNISNLNIRAAVAAYDQATAQLRQAHAAFWPSFTADASHDRTQTARAATRTVDTAAVTGGWEPDVWGELRRGSEASRASAQASAATLAGARLSAQSALASAYFELRAQDQLQSLLNETVAAEQHALTIANNRYRAGVAAKADVVSAQSQLYSSQAQALNSGIQRAQLEHAIAVLTGQLPEGFSLAAAPQRADVPAVPTGLPSTLLERRPDVAAAERKVAAANAQIGVARSAFFPTLTLSGSVNYSADHFAHLISVANRVWSAGPTLALSLFDGGLRRAQSAQARAAYDASAAAYRLTVLSAFQQVEDSLAALRLLEQQAAVEDQTVKAAAEAEALTLNQYKAGTVPYSSVIAAQTAALASRQAALTVWLNRLNSSVSLITALGGGWDSAQSPRP